MRELEFRAKPCYTGGSQPVWVYGTFQYIAQRRISPGATDNGTIEERHDKGLIVDIYGTKTEVLCDTVGMFTGVRDKDGNKIFEGDVVQNGEGGYFYIVYWWDEEAAFRAKQVGSSSTIGLNYLRKELRIVGNCYDNPELLQYKPAPPKRCDRHTLLPCEFRIKGMCNNGCMCQPDVIYVARWLTKADGKGKAGRLRIWSHGSYVEDGKRQGSYCDWEKSILQNYQVLPDSMSREAQEKFKREYLAFPKP